MPRLHFTAEQQSMLFSFIDQPQCGDSETTDALERLLGETMDAVNVRRLELVDPESVRELLRSTFEVMKLRHLHENGLLSSAQFQSRIEVARRRARVT
ncbi:MAG: hypothetical protein ABJL54_07390 [Halioglobus sp.]